MLTEKLRKKKKRKWECCGFTDYKAAYNTVNRKRLYKIMKRKCILADDQVDFWKACTRHSASNVDENDFTSRMECTRALK
jgi:hypothetical protein